jgi:hypothetical protein
MKRRDFIRQTAIGLTAIATNGKGLCWAEKKPSAPHIIPGNVPDYSPGTLPLRWADEAMISKAANLHPFDLQGRMQLAVNARTSCVDPNLGYIGFSQMFFQTRPAHMIHLVGDFVDDMGRHTDSLWLNRSATDDRNNDEIVHRIAQNAMDSVDHGIAWNPPQKPFLWWGVPDERIKGRWAHLPEGTRVTLGLITYYRATGDKRAFRLARSMVHELSRISQKSDKYVWFPDFNVEQIGAKILPMRIVTGAKVDVNDPKSGANGMGGDLPACFMGMMLLPALRYYEESRDSAAAELAVKFSRLVVDLLPEYTKNIGNVHTALCTASGIMRTGSLMGIPEYEHWAEGVYRSFVGQDFIPDFGWTPENTSRPRVNSRLCCETCSTVDYLELALQLAQSRDEKYWDHVERITMNQLLEGQLLRTDFVERLPERVIKPLPNIDAKWFTTDHVLNRALGGFGIISGPNDWIQTGEDIMTVQCCFGSGPRGLYDAWYYASQEDRDRVRVNLQFSKRLPSAVITSYMPGKAVVEVEMTAGKKLQVRKPGWAAAEQTRVLVNGAERKLPLEGTYFDFGGMPAGTKVRIEFPNGLQQKTERIGEVEFHTEWRGNAVVKMEPAGEIYPLYQGRGREGGVTPLSFINHSPINPL